MYKRRNEIERLFRRLKGFRRIFSRFENVSAGVILIHVVGVKLTHLGEHGGFWPPTMLTQEQAVEIKVLARRGVAIREIARQLGCSRNTVKRYLHEPDAVRYRGRQPRPTKLDPFKEYVLQRIEAARPHWIPATVLHRELRERGYGGGLTQLKGWLVPYKHREQEPVVRFETAPGQQLQADFTHVRRGRHALLAFVATFRL